jgi:hypothetical protein
LDVGGREEELAQRKSRESTEKRKKEKGARFGKRPLQRLGEHGEE